MPLKILTLTSARGGGGSRNRRGMGGAEIGGAEKLLLDLSNRYDRERFSISYCNIFSGDGENEQFVKEIQKRELQYFAVGGNQLRNLPKIIYQLIGIVRRERIDIVHAHLLHASIAGYIVASLAKPVKLIITRHYTNDIAYKHKTSFLEKLDARAARGATKAIAVSSEVKKDLLAQGVSPARIEIVHNGTDLNLFEETENDAQILPENLRGKFLLVTVGNLNFRKGHSFLIRALAKVAAKVERIGLIIIGEGAERAALENLAKDLGVADKVWIAGFRSDVPALLKNAGLYVHPSVYEPFGIAILEAMAARKCVVASRVGGIPDIVVDGETGFLVPPSNADALADAVLRAVANPRQIKKMGEAGRRRVEEKFLIETVAEKYEKLYESCAQIKRI